MNKNPRAVFFVIFFTALFFYFYTESLLRQAAVSNTNAEEFKLKQLIDALPSSIRDDYRYKMEKASIQDRINEAKTDVQKADALTMMALYTKDKAEKEKLFADIVAGYPELPNAATAFKYFLLKPNSPHAVSIEQFQVFISKCPSMEQFQIWNMGLQQLGRTKQKNEVKLQYLRPLLDYKPEYRNYFRLYDTLSKIAYKLKENDASDKAKELKKACLSLPSIEAIRRNQLTPSKKPPAKKKSAKKNQGGNKKSKKKVDKKVDPQKQKNTEQATKKK